MKMAVAGALLAALILVAPASAGIGYYAKWSGTPPITVKVSGVSNFPAADQTMIRAALADWSLSSSVDYLESNSGKVKMEICDGCGFLTRPNASNYVLHGATIQIDRQWLGNSWMQGVYCHELGHGLGLGETSDDPGSCMADATNLNNQHPSQMDYDELTVMYPLGGAKR
jgi:hypothetical protein